MLIDVRSKPRLDLPAPSHHWTLDDGTIRRYDNSHEDTKGHELHVAPDPEPRSIEFAGMVDLWERFWREIPKSALDVETDTSPR